MPRHTKERTDKTRLEKSEGRFTIKGMLGDEFYNFMHIERRKFFYTAIDLTIHPAQSIKMVIKGYKKYLYPYFNYLILLGTITIFLSVRYKFFVSGLEVGEQSNVAGMFLDNLGFDKQFRLDFFYYAEQFATIVNIIAIPMFAICSFLMFSKSKYNLAEHFILNVYIAAQQLLFLWFTVPFLELFHSQKDLIMIVYSVLTFSYNVWVYTVFFDGNKALNIFKGCLTVIIAFIAGVPINYFFFYIFRPFIKWLDAIF